MRRLAWMMMVAASWPAIAAAQEQVPAAPARTTAQAEDDVSDEPDIIVTGSRNLPGAVIGDITPDQQLGPADIRSYGVNSVAELLTELGPQTRSGAGGAPVVLLNGKRIAGFQEIRDIPTEAIARVDILPEEVALKYGYRADQRVVNIVLRRRFRAVTVEATDRYATDGGRNAPQLALDLLTIRTDNRVNVHAEYQQASALTESERDIIARSTDDGDVNFDQRPFRTLLPATRSLTTNMTYARPVGGVSATINGELTATSSRGRFGLPTATFSIPAASPFAIGGVAAGVTRVLDSGDFDPLRQRNSSITGHLAASGTGRVGEWNYYLGAAYDRVESETFTDVGVDAAAFQARLAALDPLADPRGSLTPAEIGAGAANRGNSTSSIGGFDGLVNGSLFALPAGRVSTSLKFGAQTSDFSSRSFRAGSVTEGQVSRDRGNAQLNVDLPIASRKEGVLGWLGSLSLNGNVGVDRLSDFGTLASYGYGANWAPLTGVRLIGSINHTEEAPTPQQLGNPSVATPNVRIFDYVRGETATVTTVTGGNPFLVENNRRVARAGLTLRPWEKTDVNFTANYTSTRVDDPIASFPAATAAIEAVFPERFTRDGGGSLLRIDTRPINYARSERSELRWGVNVSMALKSRLQKQFEAFRAGTGPNPFAGLRPPGQRGSGQQPTPAGAGATTPDRAGAVATGAQPGGAVPRSEGGFGSGGGRGPGGFGGGFRGGGGGFGGRGAQGGGRINFALYHTWHFTDRVVVAEGGPTLDLLNGDAIGASGGSPRHELEGQAGYSNNGLGARLSVNFRSATDVEGGTPTAPQPLRFGALTTANLRLFADLGGRIEWVRAHPWLRGTRVTLGVDNLFNTRQDVRDANGTTPVSYQPDYLDPLGRTVRLSIRKLFF